jgi:hypothetical protein
MRYKVGWTPFDGTERGVRSRVKAIDMCAALLNIGIPEVSFVDEQSGLREIFKLNYDTGQVQTVCCELIKIT